jgi:hypothetical protein
VRSRYKLINLGGAASHRTTPRPPLEDVQAMGYHAAFFAANCIRSAVLGLWEYLADLRTRGSQADLDFIQRTQGTPFENWYAFTGYEQLRRLEERYLPAEALAARYGQSKGNYYEPTGAGAGPEPGA